MATDRAEAPTTFVLEQRFRYDYAAPVSDLRHRLLVQPRRRHGRQRLVDAGHCVTGATCGVTVGRDRHGNDVVDVLAPEVASHVEFRSWARVQMRGSAPTIVPRSSLGDRRWTEPTALTRADDRLQEAARRVRSRSPLARAEEICGWTYDHLAYAFGATSVRTTAAEALDGGRGVCQDYAHVMLAVCRAAGVAARYVSGHLVGEGGSHAWVEVLSPLPDGRAEAIAFDPTHRRRAVTGYLTIAVGRDYVDVPPTSGTFRGSCPGLLAAEKRLRIDAAA